MYLGYIVRTMPRKSGYQWAIAEVGRPLDDGYELDSGYAGTEPLALDGTLYSVCKRVVRFTLSEYTVEKPCISLRYQDGEHSVSLLHTDECGDTNDLDLGTVLDKSTTERLAYWLSTMLLCPVDRMCDYEVSK